MTRGECAALDEDEGLLLLVVGVVGGGARPGAAVDTDAIVDGDIKGDSANVVVVAIEELIVGLQ